MSNTFVREPIDHGDNNIWHDYIMNQVRRGALGALSMELYDNGGALTLSAGYAGIDDGTNKGTIYCTGANVVSLAAITVGHWAKVELSVSGTSVTISAAELVDTDETVVPAAIIAAYDFVKQGYYSVATKRLAGIAYKNGAGVLGKVLPCPSGVRWGLKEVSVNSASTVHADGAIDSDTTVHADGAIDSDSTVTADGGVDAGGSGTFLKTKVIAIGDWNMDTTASLNVAHGLTLAKIRSFDVKVYVDGGAGIYNLNVHLDAVQGYYWCDSTYVRLFRTALGCFDNVSFQNTGFNRGWITIVYEA